MRLNPFRLLRSRVFLGVLMGAVVGGLLFYLGYAGMKATSTNEYCESCHVHPQATSSWKEGKHVKNDSGVMVNCIDCHLPPEGMDFLVEKAKAGARDLYAFYFTDTSKIDWEGEKSTLEAAAHFTFDESYTSCHADLFQLTLSDEGVDAHLHYKKNADELLCINCHLKTGHFHEDAEEQIIDIEEEVEEEIEWAPLISEIPEGAFVDYTETIPGSSVKFEMVAVPGGTFTMGSPEAELGHEPDEGPQRTVQVSPFWMGKFEVSWREFDAYYSQTVTRGKNEMGEREADATTGPTPPYGSPDQGWGKGSRPAITMSHHAALKYCEWLSSVTGRQYRLPTEAEWEYAARAESSQAFFFLEATETVSWLDSLKARLLGGSLVDEELLGKYAVYRSNSKLRTQPARSKQANPLGLYNMYGNVKEFMLDYYAPDTYVQYPEGQAIVDPRGPSSGDEWVVRGGSYRSDPEELRSAARDRTYTQLWLKTDPQTPKSVWWYSDSKEVGFRVVREKEKE
jgi:formylglycine-generating enzyme required for sulfatase activity/nitrate/TMAO reductase-like tetraheme cytochrome c subunit